MITAFDEPESARRESLVRGTPWLIVALAAMETACAHTLGSGPVVRAQLSNETTTVVRAQAGNELRAALSVEALPTEAFSVEELSRVVTSDALDRDGDGLLDAEENELAARFAPIVILHRRDSHRPASLPWLLSRTDPFAKLRGDSRTAGMLAQRMTPLSRAEQARWRSGSDDPKEWTTYVHVYPRAGGGINLQYWFFYPYNDGPWFFDHDHDWEHVTVRLSAARTPVRMEFAQHANDRPGVSLPWSSVQRDAEHPLVFSARGTHASYASGARLAWFESVADCTEPSRCAHPVWKTWLAGGLQNLGERGRPLCLERTLAFRDRWGATGIIPGTSAPFGPLYHRGYCSDALGDCTQESRPARKVARQAGAVARIE